VFSPYYRWATKRLGDRVNPLDHCAINVCLYGPRNSARWTMTERGARHVQRSMTHFQVGPSGLAWDGEQLRISLDERSAPLPKKVYGTVTVTPRALSSFWAQLDAAGQHRWQPIAPCSHVDVQLQAPALRWQGAAYFDSNEGDTGLAQAFTRWDWMRTQESDGATTVIYDVDPRGERPSLVAQRFMPNGTHQALECLPRTMLPKTPLWRIARQVRAPHKGDVRLLQTLEDTPFYARSLLALPAADGVGRVHAVHESLDARRLDAKLVQCMLPFRMPRRR
jgi:carotenoid 1,2-hydratase